MTLQKCNFCEIVWLRKMPKCTCWYQQLKGTSYPKPLKKFIHIFVRGSDPLVTRLKLYLISLHEIGNLGYSTFTNAVNDSVYTLFSKRSAHENHPNFLRSLGHRPRPRVILILSIGLESNFCILLSRPFDKIDMTLGQGQWPRVTGRTGVNQCALLLEKSVVTIRTDYYATLC